MFQNHHKDTFIGDSPIENNPYIFSVHFHLISKLLSSDICNARFGQPLFHVCGFYRIVFELDNIQSLESRVEVILGEGDEGEEPGQESLAEMSVMLKRPCDAVDIQAIHLRSLFLRLYNIST